MKWLAGEIVSLPHCVVTIIIIIPVITMQWVQWGSFTFNWFPKIASQIDMRLLKAPLQNPGFPFLFTNANSRLFPQYDLISSLTMFSNFCLGSGMFLRIPTLLPWWPKFPPPPPPDHNADFLPDFLHFYFLFHICPIFTLHQSQRSAKITIAVKASTWSGQHGL